jgi:hypothetical protein
MQKLIKFFLFFFFVFYILISAGCLRLVATNYYVSNEGNDNADGKTPGTAWESISKVNKQTFIPGDSVLFRRGDTWYDELVINSSGKSGKVITYGSYGSGRRPKILGSAKIERWTNVGGNIWKSVDKTTDPSVGAPHNGESKANNKYPGGVWFEEKNGKIHWGHQEKNISGESDFTELKSEYDWGWYNGHIYLTSSEDPAIKYSSLQVSQRQSCIKMVYGKINEYITINGLELMFAQSCGFYSGYPEYKASGLNFIGCHIGFIGIKGAASAYGLSVCHSNMLIKDNIINDCGRRGISYNMYRSSGLTFKNVIVENNLFYNGYHTTSIDVSSMGLDTIKDFIFRNNIVYDEAASSIVPPEDFSSNSIYIAASAKSYYKNFYIYNNIILNTKARSLLVGKVDSLYVSNNTFYAFNKNAKSYSMITFTGENNVFFRNNIVYGNMPADSFYGSCVLDERGKTNFFERDYNLYYQEDQKQVMTATAGKYYQMSQWLTYRSVHGYDKNSPSPSDPKFETPFLNLNLTEQSPARSAGKNVIWIKTDFYGNIMNSPPDLGAIQYGSKPHYPGNELIEKLKSIF